MISGFFVWWYSAGLNQAFEVVFALIAYVGNAFSLPTLLKTLFQPWKNDVLRAQNVSLAEQVKIWQLNLASRIIGFLIRFIVIVMTLIILAVLFVVVGVGLVVWLLVPLLVVALPILGVGRLFT